MWRIANGPWHPESAAVGALSKDRLMAWHFMGGEWQQR